MLIKDQEGVYTWHPAFEKLADEFGEVEAFRRTVNVRLLPTSWSGSRVSILEAYLPPLEKWFDHQIAALAQWAKEAHYSLERKIASESCYDEDN